MMVKKQGNSELPAQVHPSHPEMTHEEGADEIYITGMEGSFLKCLYPSSSKWPRLKGTKLDEERCQIAGCNSQAYFKCD